MINEEKNHSGVTTESPLPAPGSFAHRRYCKRSDFCPDCWPDEAAKRAAQELPENVAIIVEEWLGMSCTMHFWERDGTFFIVAHSQRAQNNIYCLRVFPVGGELQLSQDNILYI